MKGLILIRLVEKISKNSIRHSNDLANITLELYMGTYFQQHPLKYLKKGQMTPMTQKIRKTYDFKRRFRLKTLDEFSDIYNPLLSISTENQLYRRDLRAVCPYFEINRQSSILLKFFVIYVLTKCLSVRVRDIDKNSIIQASLEARELIF